MKFNKNHVQILFFKEKKYVFIFVKQLIIISTSLKKCFSYGEKITNKWYRQPAYFLIRKIVCDCEKNITMIIMLMIYKRN